MVESATVVEVVGVIPPVLTVDVVADVVAEVVADVVADGSGVVVVARSAWGAHADTRRTAIRSHRGMVIRLCRLMDGLTDHSHAALASCWQ